MTQQQDTLELEYLRQRAHTLSRALFLRLDEYVEDFPTGTPLELIQLFKKITEEADQTILTTTDVDRLGLICRTLNTIATHAMTLLDHAHTAQTPRGLAQFLDCLREALQPDSVLLVTPLADYNYTIANYFPWLDNLLSGTLVPEETWKTISQRYTNGLNVVRFPRVERGNVLLHAIFGHEFGHPIAARFLETEEPSEYQRELIALNVRVNQEFKADLDAESDNVKRTKLHGELCTIAEEIRRRALEELISDAVAALLFGASALFAAAEIMIPDGLDVLPRPDDFYPPSRYRLRIIYQVLTDTGHLAALRSLCVHTNLEPVKAAVTQYLDYLKDLTTEKNDLVSIDTIRLVKIGYEWLERSLPAGLLFAQSSVDNIVYSTSVLENEVPEALHRVHLGVPPSEVGTYPDIRPVDWRTPILAGWMHKLYFSAKMEMDWVQRLNKISDVQTLSLKGVEDGLLRAEYQSKHPTALSGEQP